MTLAPWETIDSDWVSHVPTRFNLSALVIVPDEPDPEPPNKGGKLSIVIDSLELDIEIAPFKITMVMDGKHVFETFISHLPLVYPIDAEIEFLNSPPLHLKCVLSDVSGALEYGSTIFASIPPQPACEACVYPRYYNSLNVLNRRGTIIGNIQIQQQWLELCTLNKTIEQDDSNNEPRPRVTRDCLKLIPLPTTVSEAITRPPPPPARTLDEMLDDYIELFAYSSNSIRSSPYVIEPYIPVWTILGDWVNSLLSRLNPIRWIFGETADALHVYASLTSDELLSPRRADANMFLLVELLSEGEVLHAVKSRPLSSTIECFLDLPCEGESIRLTLLEEDVEIAPSSPSKARSGFQSPTRLGQPLSARFSPSSNRSGVRYVTGAPRIIEQVDIQRREMRKASARCAIRGVHASICNVRLATRVAGRCGWLAEILPSCITAGDKLLRFMLGWIRSMSDDGFYPIGIAVLLDGSLTTLFDILRTDVELVGRETDFTIDDAFRCIHRIPAFPATGLLELQNPWLSVNQIQEYNFCGNHQKSFLFHSYIQGEAGDSIIALCELHSSEVEFMVIYSGCFWSVPRNKTWKVDDEVGSVKRILTVIMGENIYLNLRRTSKLSECIESVTGRSKGHWSPLFGAQDMPFQQLLNERIASTHNNRLVLTS